MLISTLSQFSESAEYTLSHTDLEDISWQAEFSLVSYGVRIGIRVNEPTVLERLLDYLPPGWQELSSSVVDQLYLLVVGITGKNPGNYAYHQLYRGQEKLSESIEIEDIFEAFDSDLRLQVGIAVKEWLFVHAGVVGWGKKAIIIPGRSFSGKTTLVAALVKAGATYYSDEYAIFDSNGLVHPFPRRLSVRQGEGERAKRCAAAELGGKSGSEALPVGLIVHTEYKSGVQWRPQEISPGQAVLTLLDNTLVACLRPEFALPILGKAVSGAVALKSERGEAEETAKVLLQNFDNSIN